MARISRRRFAGLAAAAAAAPFTRATLSAAPITAAELVDRIRTNIGVDWRADTVDTMKAGDPSAVVTGIVTTSMATIAVLRQAMKAGANVIVTAQPTFFGRADVPSPPPGRGATTAPPLDQVFTAKRELIARNNLVVFRLSDHWRLRRPDPFAQGLAAALGWAAAPPAGDPARAVIAATSLDALASHVKTALGARGGVRVVGDPGLYVRRVRLLPGTTPIQDALRMLPDVDVIIAGEVREWETVEYARDKVFAGERKGLILVGRVVSDEPGMDVCARWLTTLAPDVPVRHIPAGDPYWRPAR